MAALVTTENTQKVLVEAPESIAKELPADPLDRAEILRLGIREWKIRRALDAYRRGEGTLAYAARRAGISLWEIGAVAYAHGLEPGFDSRVLEGEMTLERAAFL